MNPPYVGAAVQVWWNGEWRAGLVTFVYLPGPAWIDPVDVSMFQRGGGLRPMRMVERWNEDAAELQKESASVWRWAAWRRDEPESLR